MAQITVKRKDGSIGVYVKPVWCSISDEEWENPFGYCWGFALHQDRNEIGKSFCEKQRCSDYDS